MFQNTELSQESSSLSTDNLYDALKEMYEHLKKQIEKPRVIYPPLDYGFVETEPVCRLCGKEIESKERHVIIATGECIRFYESNDDAPQT